MRRLPTVLFLAATLLLLMGALSPVALRDRPADARKVPGPAIAPERRDGTSAGISAAQRRLRAVPGDWMTWADLGAAYVEQARVTADPHYYPKAEGALRRSLDLETATNWRAMAGMGALANARHEFRAALDWGRRAQRINPVAATVNGVVVDALTELGEYAAAREATQHMLNTAPGIAAFTRASYDLEQHGQVAEARAALVQALNESTDPADVAYCRYYLGELAFNGGDLAGAVSEFQAGSTADPSSPKLTAGLAKAHLAQGDTAAALREYERAARALPLPELLIEYGDALASVGQHRAAQQQYDTFSAEQRLFAANGGVDHLTSAMFFADHGQPAPALAEAELEWTARHSVLAADALAWALHRNGRDREALEYATKAMALGWRNASFRYHRGMIHYALGHPAPARADLTAALAINPYFDALQAPVARQTLATIEGQS